MSSVNKCTIIGRLGKDPELRFTTSGQGVARFSVATSEKWKDKNSGEMQEKTEWHNILVWGKLAELCNDYLKKGRQVYLEGKLQTRSWEKDGVKKYTTEIVCNNVVFLGNSDNSTKTETIEPTKDKPFKTTVEVEQKQFNAEMDGDIPF